ncbi:hypothetical protein IWZ03DRAFT_202628 [Phyllosticta citriasiana]|uniref:Uncharacterized protein n=1 Tax=Phyllosticta citriasiana TaxID=595635 RepID=A0ABR1KKJ8_9PEZI
MRFLQPSSIVKRPSAESSVRLHPTHESLSKSDKSADTDRRDETDGRMDPSTPQNPPARHRFPHPSDRLRGRRGGRNSMRGVCRHRAPSRHLRLSLLLLLVIMDGSLFDRGRWRWRSSHVCVRGAWNSWTHRDHVRRAQYRHGNGSAALCCSHLGNGQRRPQRHRCSRRRHQSDGSQPERVRACGPCSSPALGRSVRRSISRRPPRRLRAVHCGFEQRGQQRKRQRCFDADDGARALSLVLVWPSARAQRVLFPLLPRERERSAEAGCAERENETACRRIP